MGNTSSSSSSSSLGDSPLTFLCCFGPERKGLGKSQELLEEEEEDHSINVSSIETSSILSANATTVNVKSEESIMVEKRSSEMLQLDKALLEGQLSIDEYAPKCNRLAVLKEEALEAKKMKNSPVSAQKASKSSSLTLT